MSREKCERYDHCNFANMVTCTRTYYVADSLKRIFSYSVTVVLSSKTSKLKIWQEKQILKI
jgi:hypothetical protein